MSKRTIVLNIPVLVGSNGKWCASGYAGQGDDIDWGFMADNLLDDEDKYPNAEKRYLVTVSVEVPDDKPYQVTPSAVAPVREPPK